MHYRYTEQFNGQFPRLLTCYKLKLIQVQIAKSKFARKATNQ